MKVEGAAYFSVDEGLKARLSESFSVQDIGGEEIYANRLNVEVRYLDNLSRVVTIDKYDDPAKYGTFNIRENQIGVLLSQAEAKRISEFAIANSITTVEIYVDNLLKPVVESPGLRGSNVSADEINRQLQKSDLVTEYLYTSDPLIHPLPKAPVISDPSLVDEPVALSTKTWNFNSDEDDAEYRYVINSRPDHIFTNEPWEGATSAMAPGGLGDYYLHLQARDADGNLSPTYSYFVRIDNTAPSVLGLVSVSLPTRSHVFNWSSDEENVEYQYATNMDSTHTFTDEPWRPDTQVTLEGLDGTFYLHIRPRDAAGNIGDTVSVHVTLDNTPPVITGLANVEGRHHAYTFTWASTDLTATYQYQNSSDPNFSLAEEGTAPFRPNTSANTGIESDTQGLRYFHIRAMDALGNIGEQETYSVYIDRKDPVITGIESVSTPVQSATWSWGADEPNVQYRYTISSGIVTDLSSETYGDITSVTKDDGDGLFFLYIQARDEAGNCLLYTSPSPRDRTRSRMPSSA